MRVLGFARIKPQFVAGSFGRSIGILVVVRWGRWEVGRVNGTNLYRERATTRARTLVFTVFFFALLPIIERGKKMQLTFPEKDGRKGPFQNVQHPLVFGACCVMVILCT